MFLPDRMPCCTFQKYTIQHGFAAAEVYHWASLSDIKGSFRAITLCRCRYTVNLLRGNSSQWYVTDRYFLNVTWQPSDGAVTAQRGWGRGKDLTDFKHNTKCFSESGRHVKGTDNKDGIVCQDTTTKIYRDTIHSEKETQTVAGGEVCQAKTSSPEEGKT